MLKSLYIFLSVLALLISSGLMAQAVKTTRIMAKIQVESTAVPVPFAFVANSKTGIGKETNEKGTFRMDIEPSDTILFRCMGFENNSWALSDLNLESDTLVLNVSPKTYALDEIKVLQFRSYAAFRSMVANMPMMKTNEYKLPFSIPLGNAMAEKKAESGSFGVAFSVGGNRQTRDEKQYHRYIAKEELYERYNQLTSKENLQAFTQLEGVKLDSFIVFLRSKHNINPKLSEYDMMLAINQVYENFLALQTDSIKIKR